jgi:hypothetical protein
MLALQKMLITGASQAGKAALVTHVFRQHRSVSFDRPSEAEQAERESAAFFQRHGTPLIIDEVRRSSVEPSSRACR